MVSKTAKNVIWIIVWFLVIIYCGNIARFAFIDEPNNLPAILSHISEGTTSVQELAWNASDYTYAIIKWKTFDTPCTAFGCFIRIYPFIRVGSPDGAPYLFKSKVGACGEHSNLFTYLLQKLNINTTQVVIYSPSGNHILNEVWENGTATMFDSSNVPYIESREMEMYPNRQVLFAQRVLANGSLEDITKFYAGASYGQVTLKVKVLGKPYADEEIYFQKEKSPKIEFITGDAGSVLVGLAGNHTYQLTTDNFFLKPISINITDGETDVRIVDFRLHTKLLLNLIILFVLIIIFVLLIVFWIVPRWLEVKHYFKKRK